MEKTKNGTKKIGENISFTLIDISNGYKACNISEPASISNTVLDLTRKDKGIKSRLPDSIISYGYDLKKKTGSSDNGSFCGEFVYVGLGSALHSWLIWDENCMDEKVLQNMVPLTVQSHISNDEGALFSVIDYCDVFSQALFGEKKTVLRVQNPMKWQPNEIDGLYIHISDEIFIPVEAKALSTGDDINLEQMLGQYQTFLKKRPNHRVMPVAAAMKPYGMDLAILEEQAERLVPIKMIRVKIIPKIENWN